MLLIYEHPRSPFSQKIKICLHEKKLKFEKKIPGFLTYDEDFLRVSPRREIPVLVHNSYSVTNSPTIVEYLEEAFPESPKVLPEEPHLRALVRNLQEVCDTQLDAAIYGVTEVTSFDRGTEAEKKQIMTAGRRDIYGFYRYFAKVLGEKDFLCGASPTLADFSLLPHIYNSILLNFPCDTEPELNKWYQRMLQRESVQCALADAENDTTFAETIESIKTCKSKRLYRDHRLEWIIKNGGLNFTIEGLKNNNIRFSTRIS